MQTPKMTTRQFHPWERETTIKALRAWVELHKPGSQYHDHAKATLRTIERAKVLQVSKVIAP